MVDWMALHAEAFCWAKGGRDRIGYDVACDRVKEHFGPHSWEALLAADQVFAPSTAGSIHG